MFVSYFLLLPLTVAVGWSGTRTALHLRYAKGTQWDVYFMLTLFWSPLAIALLALLLSLFGSNP
jgi:hypothetical protein